MKLRIALPIAALAAILAAPAAIAADPGWYVSGMAGLTFAEDADGTDSGVPFTTSFNTGFNLGAAGGYAFPNGLRLEGELAYRQTDVDKITIGGLAFAGGGNANAFSVMGNAFYDFDLGGGWKPYVGGGIGLARVEASKVTIAGFALVDDDDTVFAYQVGGGMGYTLTPQATVFLDYRYFATEDPTFRDVGGATLKTELHTHNVSLGMRYRF